MNASYPLYPEIEPYATGRLQVSSLHNLYYEEVGSPQGQPLIYLHGGPGGGCSERMRRFFDPAHYRAVLFDQRGAGHSTPNAELEENTTWDLVEDIERLRRHLEIERWLVFGGSWGSTLSLAYAVTHPQRVTGLILRGIFLCRKSEIDWLYFDGASHVIPEGWERFIGFLPPALRRDPLAGYYQLMTCDDPETRLAAAREWCRWETTASRIIPNWEEIDKDEDPPERILPLGRIEAHYFVNNSYFESEAFLLEKAATIDHIPTIIVQGRYDMVCPATSAWELKRAMPSADLRIVPLGGHSIKDEDMAAQLVRAAEEFKGLK